MKKSLFMLAALLFAVSLSVPAFAYDDPSFSTWNNKSSMSEAAGQGTPVRVLKFVRYSSADADGFSLVSGDVVIYDTVSDDGVTVRQTNTSGDPAIAGIIVTTIRTADNVGTITSANSDRGRRNWGWMLVHGPANANVRAGGTNGATAGEPFYCSRDGGAVTTFEAIDLSCDLAIAAWQTYVNDQLQRLGTGKGGIVLDAGDGTSTNIEVFVNLE